MSQEPSPIELELQHLQVKYKDLCTRLGDIVVKLEGFQNQKAIIINEIAELDKKAGELVSLLNKGDNNESQESKSTSSS